MAQPHAGGKTATGSAILRRTMKPPSAEFELSVNEASGPPEGMEVEGVLRSVALDPGMHPDGTLEVFIATRLREGGPTGSYLLDSFHIRSLLEYLNNQSDIREVLEHALAADQEEIDPEGDPIRGEVWSWAEVESLHLRQREGPEEEGMKTFFELTIRCDWLTDHFLEATFRDGKFVELHE
jgi:hypothetical protein